jgi:hypothetical protein
MSEQKVQEQHIKNLTDMIEMCRKFLDENKTLTIRALTTAGVLINGMQERVEKLSPEIENDEDVDEIAKKYSDIGVAIWNLRLEFSQRDARELDDTES